jgi:hypothetical protein
VSDLENALKRAVAALERADVRYVVGGSVACWARGGPLATADVDLMIRPRDADAALEALAEAGMRTERPPEQWLYKAWCDNVLVDLIYEPVGLAVDDALFNRSESLNVAGLRVEVMAMEDVMTTKLLALNEHALDLEPLLAIARSLREQIDWGEVRRRTAGSAYARAFLSLVDELGLSASPATRPRAATRVRVA